MYGICEYASTYRSEYGVKGEGIKEKDKGVSVLKLIEIVILRVYYTIPFGSSFFR